MKRTDAGMIWGVLLILGGVLALLQAFGFVGESLLWSAIWCVIFGATGIGFLWRFATGREQYWWAVIPGLTLLSLAILMAAAMLGFGESTEQGTWLGAMFLAAIGLAFWTIYLENNERWWAIIPGGALFSVALVALFSNWIDGVLLGSVLFFGLATTFGLVYVLPGPHRRATWALIPAGVLVVMGFVLALGVTSLVNYLWALALIAAGLFLIFRQRGGGEMTRHG